MRVLITGAGGMLGGELAPLLAAAHEVAALRHADCDITEEAAVREAVERFRPRVIINCAAQADVDGAERDPSQALAVNGAAPGHLARAAEALGARLFHLSTDYVFDGEKKTPYTESDPTHPLSKYGESKLEGERQVFATRQGRERHLVIRTSWLFGLHRPSFVDQVIERVLAGAPLTGVASQVSCPTWTLHLARSIAQLLQADGAGVVHVAGSGECSRHEMACYIAARLARPGAPPPEVAAITWEQLKKPARRPAYSAMTSTRFAEFGLAPLPHWRTALDEYLAIRVPDRFTAGRAPVR